MLRFELSANYKCSDIPAITMLGYAGNYKCLDMPAIELENLSAPLANWPLTRAVVVFEAVLTSWTSRRLRSKVTCSLRVSMSFWSVAISLLSSSSMSVLRFLKVSILASKSSFSLSKFLRSVSNCFSVSKRLFFSFGDFFVHPDSLQLKPVLEFGNTLALAFEEVLETQDVAAEAGFL